MYEVQDLDGQELSYFLNPEIFKIGIFKIIIKWIYHQLQNPQNHKRGQAWNTRSKRILLALIK